MKDYSISKSIIRISYNLTSAATRELSFTFPTVLEAEIYTKFIYLNKSNSRKANKIFAAEMAAGDYSTATYKNRLNLKSK